VVSEFGAERYVGGRRRAAMPGRPPAREYSPLNPRWIEREAIPVRRLTTLVIVAVLAVGLSACGKHGAKNVYSCPNKGSGVGFKNVKSGKLTVETSLPSAGWWTGAAVDKLTGGYEFAFAKDLCAQLGISRVRIVTEPRANIEGGKTTGFDLAIARIAITPTLASKVDVSSPYLTAGSVQYAVVLPKGSANTALVNTAIAKLKSAGTLTSVFKGAPTTP
jgi:ABC-type amino acid transport substrate-binding protein